MFHREANYSHSNKFTPRSDGSPAEPVFFCAQRIRIGPEQTSETKREEVSTENSTKLVEAPPNCEARQWGVDDLGSSSSVLVP